MMNPVKPRSDAVRTEPIFSDVNGHSFWRLKACNGGPDIVLQGKFPLIGSIWGFWRL